MRNYNLDDFQKWIEDHEQEAKAKIAFAEGDFVKPNVPFKKLVARISSGEDDHKEICKEFYNGGGRIVSIENKNLTIEVDSGQFYIHEMYVAHD
jgi:hypothetical protein